MDFFITLDEEQHDELVKIADEQYRNWDVLYMTTPTDHFYETQRDMWQDLYRKFTTAQKSEPTRR